MISCMAYTLKLCRVVIVTIIIIFLARWLILNGSFRKIFSGDEGCVFEKFRLKRRELFSDGPQRPLGLTDNANAKLLAVLAQMDESLKEEKQSFISFLFQPVINNHDFEYLLNPSTKCLDSSTQTLIVVPSAPENFEKRLNVRRGEWGSYAGDAGNRAKILFFIGLTSSADVQREIDKEYATFQDIVQESFEDKYKNIRLKAVSMLKWAVTFCQRAKYVIRHDDDVSANVTSAMEAVKRAGLKYANFIAGRVRVNDRPARNAQNKVYLSVLEYPEPSFPPFALGGLLGYPMLTVELLYQAALRVKPIWLDNVYITGMCSQKIGAKLLNDSAFIFGHKNIGNFDQ